MRRLLACMLLLSSVGCVCEDRVAARAVSSTRVLAELHERSCGATTGLQYYVDVSSEGTSTRVLAFEQKIGDAPKLAWLDATTLEVRLAPQPLDIAEASANGVRIRYAFEGQPACEALPKVKK